MLHFPRPNQRVGIDAMAAGIQQLLERLDGMQAQLEEFDNDIAKLQVKKLEMLDGMQALRQDMLGICLTTVADLRRKRPRGGAHRPSGEGPVVGGPAATPGT